MSLAPVPSTRNRSSLKEPAGWFAAGQSFRRALTLLSDGGFKLFAYICLQADRRTGCFRATHRELAAALGKSKRAIGTYVAELEAAGVCLVVPGKNQFGGTSFEISDAYWPYQRHSGSPESLDQKAYVESVREWFLSLGCGSGKFGAAEEAAARDMRERSIPLPVIEEAMLMGACRKYSSWFGGQALEPIRTLGYFESIVAEIREKPLPPGYADYLRKKVSQFAETWTESTISGCRAQGAIGDR